ncbi:alpha/beta fold hydrolase [Dyella subtropica]|uniref:alpha/beta fold hydrolase n=1 Tax=Dyella subtropica TaxID=2992127 RepID=UPI002251A197|nr:alpha/beta hydrolase [Dyella subtropica]
MWKGLASCSLVLLATFHVGPAFATERLIPPLPISDPVYTHVDRLVEIERGRRLHLHCTGNGEPTVILEAGHGDMFSTWARIQPVVSGYTRVCSYDRAGLGFSDPPRRPGAVQQVVNDLHALLKRAQIRPPYLLVGHSMGGMAVRLFAAEHSSEVVGMVLVDPTNEHQAEGYNRVDHRPYDVWHAANQRQYKEDEECVTAATAGELAVGIPLYERCVAEYDSHFDAAINKVMIDLSVSPGALRAMVWEEESSFYESARQLAAKPGNYGSMPLMVLVASPAPKRKSQTQDQADAEYQMLLGLHRDVASRSTRGTVVQVPHTGHYIQMDAPEAVLDAIAHTFRQASLDSRK